jgi:hypothetical protein
MKVDSLIVLVLRVAILDEKVDPPTPTSVGPVLREIYVHRE